MKRWLSALFTVALVTGAGVVGFSTLADAHHVDCTTNPTHPHCPTGNVPGGSTGSPQACTGPAAPHNPHCQPAGGGGTPPGGTPPGGGPPGGTNPGSGTPDPSGEQTLSGTVSGETGVQDPQVLGETVAGPGGTPTPARPATPERERPRSAG